MIAKSQRKRGLRCYHCHKLGHLQRNYPNGSQTEHEPRKPFIPGSHKEKGNTLRQQINQVSVNYREVSSSDSEIGLVMCHALSAGRKSEKTGSWIIDSEVTCHICNDASQFSSLQKLKKLQR